MKANISFARRVRLALFAAAIAMTAFPRSPAWAHAILTESSPPRNAVLTEPPREIRLQFNARLEGRVTHATLRRGETPVGPVEIVPGDEGNRLTVRIPPLGPGVYTFRYKVLATDGHLTEGVIRFTVLKR